MHFRCFFTFVGTLGFLLVLIFLAIPLFVLSLRRGESDGAASRAMGAFWGVALTTIGMEFFGSADQLGSVQCDCRWGVGACVVQELEECGSDLAVAS
jgi:hypothetical protein